MSWLRIEAILKQFLSKDTLTFTCAVDLAIVSEAAAKNAKSFNSADSPGIERISTNQGYFQNVTTAKEWITLQEIPGSSPLAATTVARLVIFPLCVGNPEESKQALELQVRLAKGPSNTKERGIESFQRKKNIFPRTLKIVIEGNLKSKKSLVFSPVRAESPSQTCQNYR